MEEIEEIRKRIVDSQPEDMEQEQVSLELKSLVYICKHKLYFEAGDSEWPNDFDKCSVNWGNQRVV